MKNERPFFVANVTASEGKLQRVSTDVVLHPRPTPRWGSGRGRRCQAAWAERPEDYFTASNSTRAWAWQRAAHRYRGSCHSRWQMRRTSDRSAPCHQDQNRLHHGIDVHRSDVGQAAAVKVGFHHLLVHRRRHGGSPAPPHNMTRALGLQPGRSFFLAATYSGCVTLVRAPSRKSGWKMASRAWLGVTPGPPAVRPW